MDRLSLDSTHWSREMGDDVGDVHVPLCQRQQRQGEAILSSGFHAHREEPNVSHKVPNACSQMIKGIAMRHNRRYGQ